MNKIWHMHLSLKWMSGDHDFKRGLTKRCGKETLMFTINFALRA